jgi:carboxypeptidase D
VGLGFSQGSVTANSEEDVAKDFLKFFKNFQNIFGIKNFKIYVTGESYAGRYVPYVSAAMLDQNDTKHYDLSGALMYDPVIGQYEYIGETATAVPSLHKAHVDCGYKDYMAKYLQFPPPGPQPVLTDPFNTTSAECDVWSIAYQAAFIINPCFNVYEINSQCPIQFDPLSYPTDLQYTYPGFNGPYFNRTDVKKAMHAPQDVSWLECNGPVFNGSNPGMYGNFDTSLDPIQKVLPQVIERTNRVLIANGNYDYELLTNGTLLSIQVR